MRSGRFFFSKEVEEDWQTNTILNVVAELVLELKCEPFQRIENKVGKVNNLYLVRNASLGDDDGNKRINFCPLWIDSA